MVGEHHRLNGHEFEQTSGGREGQGSLGCCRPWDHKELVMTKRLNNNNNNKKKQGHRCQNALKTVKPQTDVKHCYSLVARVSFPMYWDSVFVTAKTPGLSPSSGAQPELVAQSLKI